MNEILSLDPFIVRALAAGIGVAIIAGLLGCFVVLQKMAYFGDSLAHSALLGIALGVLFDFDATIGIIAVSFIFAIFLFFLQRRKILATDTLLGILSHAALSIGLVTISFIESARIDLFSYLFGDILTVQKNDLFWIYGGGIFVVLLTLWNWSSLVLMTIHEDLARAEGVKTLLTNLVYMLLITIVVAVSIRIVGILLITSMLIIPAATARQLVRLPETMAALACLFGCMAVILGIYGSIEFDTPTGPSIVTAASIIFMLVFPISWYAGKLKNIK
jgi:zinc transport system permease protein